MAQKSVSMRAIDLRASKVALICGITSREAAEKLKKAHEDHGIEITSKSADNDLNYTGFEDQIGMTGCRITEE